MLCGGASRRMGRDKAFIRRDGLPLVLRVATAALEAGATRVVAVGGDAAGLRALELEAIPDLFPGDGPLGGVITALEGLCSDVCFVASCDLLEPSATAIRAAVDAIGDHDAAVPWSDGRLQVQHAAYRRQATDVLQRHFVAGERSLAAALAAMRVRELRDVDEAALRDADAPADLLSRASRVALRHVEEQHVDIPSIEINDLRELQGPSVLDVRNPDEYEAGHIPGARLLPLPELVERVDEAGSGTVYVICKSGGRSLKACEYLRSRGVDAVNVTGGTLAWVERGHEVVLGDRPS